MAEQSVRGRFVWHDLTTPDQKGAAAFYGKALGWETMPWEQDSSYLLFAAQSGPLGGAMESKDRTPHWLPYIGTTDIDATVRSAERLGGAVLMGPENLPNGGRYAVLTDPQGAAFGVHWSSAGEGSASGAPQVGEFSWHELATSDNRAAFEFYQSLFDWERVLEHDMGPMGIYVIFGRDGAQWGGMFNKGEQGAPGPAYWLPYVRVKDVNGAVEQVKAARGACLNGPMEVPGGDWIAQLRDPYGAFFAVHAAVADVRAAQPAAAAPPREEEDRAAQGPAKKPAKKATSEGREAAATKRASAGKQRGAKAAPAKRSGKRPAKKAAKKAAKKSAAKKSAAKKSASRKRTGKKAAGKRARTKATGRKGGRKAAGKKTAARKKTARKKTAKKTARRKASGRKKRARASRARAG